MVQKVKPGILNACACKNIYIKEKYRLKLGHFLMRIGFNKPSFCQKIEKLQTMDISPLVENGYDIILTKIKSFYKMSNFYPSSISCLTYCVITNRVFSSSLLHGIIACNHLPFFKTVQILYIFTQIVKYFSFFCSFQTFFCMPFFWKIGCMPLLSSIGP